MENKIANKNSSCEVDGEGNQEVSYSGNDNALLETALLQNFKREEEKCEKQRNEYSPHKVMRRVLFTMNFTLIIEV